MILLVRLNDDMSAGGQVCDLAQILACAGLICREIPRDDVGGCECAAQHGVECEGKTLRRER